MPRFSLHAYCIIRFPAVLDLDPIETHWADGGPVSDTELTLVTREPLATVRRDFEIRGV